MTSLSVLEPVGLAIERTKHVLFRPFSLALWLKLGLCAWLANLTSSGGVQFSGRTGMPAPSGPARGPGVPQTPTGVLGWILANAWLVGLIALAGALVLALLLWLQARGSFMFVDGIVRARGAVVEPWRKFRREGDRLWGFLLVLYASALGGLAVQAAALLLVMERLAGARGWDGLTVSLTVSLIATMVCTGFAWMVALFLLDAFVVPAMYLRRIGVFEAWRAVGSEILGPYAPEIVLYALMRILIVCVVAFLAAVAMCLTCCLAGLPYIGTVILLPLYVFERAYALHFVEQVGPAWRLFVHDVPGDVCTSCGYALDGLPPEGVCPECGTPYRKVSGGEW